jgi:hypothetical protein
MKFRRIIYRFMHFIIDASARVEIAIQLWSITRD